MKKRRLTSISGFLLITLLVGASSVFAIIASGGNFSVAQFFSGIAGGEASGGLFGTRFHSTAFQPVGKGVGGVFTATIGPLSSNITSQVITSLPTISSYLISPYAVVNGSGVLVYLSALNADNVYAEITKPDSSEKTIALINNANTTFGNTSLIGKYNVTIFVNNSQGGTSVTDHFESFRGVNFNFTIVDFNTTGINSNWEFYYRGVAIKLNSSSNGIHLSEFPDTLVEIKFKSYSDRLQTTLRGINASLENSKLFGMDKLATPVSRYLLTYGINNSYNFTNSTIRIYYDDVSFTDESNLKLDKCDNWDFSNQICLSSFTDVTSSATQNTAENYFEYETTSFSGFGIREVSSPPPSGGGGSSGGGGGGGGSSCTYNPSYDWGCGEWSQCNNGIQTRTCKVTNNCGNTYGRPETQRSCTGIPSELFDITWNLDDLTIEDVGELVGVVTFESFGTVPTPVKLTFIILDEHEREVYRAKENVTVTTEEVMRWRFAEEGLNELPQGRYIAVLETLYNVDVFDEFRQEFEIGRKNSFVWFYWLVGVILFLILIAALILLMKNYKKKHKYDWTHRGRVVSGGHFYQTGKMDLLRDRIFRALKPGKRISKHGKDYYEFRENRSDVHGKKSTIK